VPEFCRSSGAEVAICAPQELASGTSQNQFDLVVLCHTLSSAKAFAAGTTVRKLWPLAKIVLLVRYDHELGRGPVHADGVAVAAEPDNLIQLSKKLLEHTDLSNAS